MCRSAGTPLTKAQTVRSILGGGVGMADEWRRSAGLGEVVARVPPVRPAPRVARRQRTLSRNGCARLQERSCSHPERIGLERSGEGVSADAAATAKVIAQEAVLTQSAYAVFF